MCGIAGFIRLDSHFGEQELSRFCQTLAHRGPNGHGLFLEEGLGLAHTRLSIQDTSEASNQPFYSTTGRFVTIFNGEIYNFKELAGECGALRTSSDTEVLVALFEKYGISCLAKLRGMFAFAMYDRQEKKLWLVRDRLGIKPLYYISTPQYFAFASELKALTGVSHIRTQLTLDHEAQNHYFHLGFVPEPHSVYSEIKKFPSAHFACVDLSLKFQPQRYWELDYKENPTISYSTAKDTVHSLLVSSVKEHLISDVPLGLFLSGGTDSSLLAAIAQKHSPQPIKTFSIGFKNSVHNEAPYAKKIAQYLKTDHTEYMLGEEETLEIMEDILSTYDEPFADSSAIPTLLISKLASQKVKVALSGEGGDELFYGYGTYLWSKRLSQPFLLKHKKLLRYAAYLIPGKRGKKAVDMLADLPPSFLSSHIFSLEHDFFPAEEVYQMPYQKLFYHGHLLDYPFQDPTKLQNIFDFEIALKDNLLVKVDRAGMRYGLETRVPFLDHRLVEYAVKLPDAFKSSGLEQKILLKDILQEYIPASFFNRPKWGFGVDLEKILRRKGLPSSKKIGPTKQYTLLLWEKFRNEKS
jgi:asparagine synthase (glutamine-hydrolysing)